MEYFLFLWVHTVILVQESQSNAYNFKLIHFTHRLDPKWYYHTTYRRGHKLFNVLWVQKYDQDTNTWNRHGESEIHQIGSSTNLFITFLSLRFFHMRRERERESQFLSMLTFPSDPTACGTFRRPPTGPASTSSENRLACSEFKS